MRVSMSGTYTRIACPHCGKQVGGDATEGGLRVRLSIVLIADDGTVHGPCPKCKGDIALSSGGQVNQAIIATRRVGIRVIKRG